MIETSALARGCGPRHGPSGGIALFLIAACLAACTGGAESDATDRDATLGAESTWTLVGTTWIWGVRADQVLAEVARGESSAPSRAVVVRPRDDPRSGQGLAGLGITTQLVAGDEVTALGADPRALLVRARTGRAPSRPLLRVLIVADTLRADVAHEEMARLAPHFDQGVRYMEAYAPATWTLPSMAAIQLGQTPSSLRAADGALIALPAGARTLAVEARARGMATAAVVANPTLGHENGFSQGFDLYDVPSYLEGWELPDATEVAARALEFVRGFAGEDLFLYLHFMDAHDPYRNHETGTTVAAPNSGSEAATGLDVEAAKTAYRSEVRHLDRVIDDLLRQIEALRPIDLLVVTADHGEEFLDHDGFGHGPTVYREVSRVPLWVSGNEVDGLGSRPLAAPVSLLTLRSLVLEPRSWSPYEAAAEPTVETFVHGPPRFAWLGKDHWFASSRWIGEEPPPETEIEAWLRGRKEGLRRLTSTSEAPASWSDLPDPAWLRLAQQLGAAAPGRWTFARGAQAVNQVREVFDPSGSGTKDRRAWCWGDCAGDRISRSDPAAPRVVLIFEADGGGGVDPAAPAPQLFSHLPDQQRWVLLTPPDRLPRDGAVSWREPPRDPVYAAGVEETMQRLRKLGYVTD